MISIVVATDKKGVIGREDKIPWRLRDDLVMLRTLTQGHTVLLGRVTYDSMAGYYDKSGRPMPGKTYIVITRNPGYTPARENARPAHSIPEALEITAGMGDENILVIGGTAIFKEILPFADRIYLTEVQTEVEGDAYFPELDMRQWREISREHHRKDDRNEYDFDVVVLERV